MDIFGLINYDLANILRRIFRIITAVVIPLLVTFLLIFAFKTAEVTATTTKVGMIFDSDTFDDMGFKWLSYQGLLRAEDQLGVIGAVYTSTDFSEIEPNVQQCAIDGNDLCIGVGWMLTDAISNTAAVYNSTLFALLDNSIETDLSNVRGILFASEDAGYLAGTLAGLMSHSNVIGDLGGMEIPPVTAFTEAYRNGAQCANENITTIISYTNDFNYPELGAQYAQGMIAQGADVVFAAAGLTGSGAILTATQSGVWAIGVDTDQYYSVFLSGTITGSNYLLTSAMKRLDNAVFYTISDVVSGTFSSGIIIYDLAAGGVGLAPFHETEEAIHNDVRIMLDMVKMAILDGRIDPLDPDGLCLLRYQQYLPFTLR
ncbi:MAG TPA: BMP family ABC transporter substrate-binding protein [Anaerolineales bacterium]|nr:BMP family ABC transporter substrate-binding protein [Anaerolineales bacterium]